MSAASTMSETKVHVKRFGGWWLLALIPLGAVLVLAPQQGEVLLYKLCQVAIAVLLSYWADRVIFRNAPQIDPAMPRDIVSAARLLTRAIVVLGILVGLTVGI